jgi:hypothetical protein
MGTQCSGIVGIVAVLYELARCGVFACAANGNMRVKPHRTYSSPSSRSCLQDGEVVLGVLGCPNLPQGTVADDDGGAGALHQTVTW